MSLRHYFRRPPSVTAAEAMELIAEGRLLVDVRSRTEHRRDRVPSSIRIPLVELTARADELPDDRVLIVFCTGGLVSTGASNLLIELGIDAVNLAGGLIGWRAAGGPLAQAEHGTG